MCDAHFLLQIKSKYEQLVLLFENSKKIEIIYLCLEKKTTKFIKYILI